MSDDSAARFRDALDRFRMRDYSGALELWRGLQRDGFEHANLELYLAVARREQARVMQVAEDYEAGFDGDVASDEVELVEDPVQRARALMRDRKYAEAAEALEEALTSPGADPFSLRLALGQTHLVLGHLQEALFHLEQARMVEAASAPLLATFGAVFRELGRPLEAEREYRRALDLDPDSSTCWYGLARLYFEDERFDQAESCLRRVLALKPGAVNATGLLEEVRRKQDQAHDLIREGLEILDSHPNYPDWHHRVAVWFTYTGELERAQDHLEKALAINPRLVKSSYQLGLISARLGQHEAACAAFERCLEHLDLDDDSGVRAARELARLGHHEEAAYEYSVVVVPEDNRASRMIDLGKRLYAESFLGQARRELEGALALKPSYPDGHYVLGRVALDQGEVAEALTHFKRAVALSPWYQQAALALGRLELGEGNVLAAREIYDEYKDRPRADLVAAWDELGEGIRRAGG